ncbi:hypothetical protein DPMN_059329 [Dreissena polymorpha]|uniref:Uncharacterized protein n=1 Tax=Dreissena polymorpha TaxID=45954 RepID=A0A9D4C3S4_DREPO|nr:hypothetical protein DPMN_059329 [Dreissena polymorpha]
MQVTVNGPKCEDAGELRLSMKDRKKLAVRAEKSTSTAATAAAAATTSTESGMQTDDTHLVIGQDELRMEIEAAMKTLLLEEEMTKKMTAFNMYSVSILKMALPWTHNVSPPLPRVSSLLPKSVSREKSLLSQI